MSAPVVRTSPAVLAASSVWWPRESSPVSAGACRSAASCWRSASVGARAQEARSTAPTGSPTAGSPPLPVSTRMARTIVTVRLETGPGIVDPSRGHPVGAVFLGLLGAARPTEADRQPRPPKTCPAGNRATTHVGHNTRSSRTAASAGDVRTTARSSRPSLLGRGLLMARGCGIGTARQMLPSMARRSGVGGRRVRRQQRGGGHDLAGLTVAACGTPCSTHAACSAFRWDRADGLVVTIFRFSTTRSA